MDRQRFEHLLEAYGADFARWPAEERTAGEAFVAAHADAARLVADERALDEALDGGRTPPVASDLLAARILAAHRRQRSGPNWRAVAALAACAVFGVLAGYGGGMMAPVAEDEAAYFASVFEAPVYDLEEGEEG